MPSTEWFAHSLQENVESRIPNRLRQDDVKRVVPNSQGSGQPKISNQKDKIEKIAADSGWHRGRTEQVQRFQSQERSFESYLIVVLNDHPLYFVFVSGLVCQEKLPKTEFPKDFS